VLPAKPRPEILELPVHIAWLAEVPPKSSQFRVAAPAVSMLAPLGRASSVAVRVGLEYVSGEVFMLSR